MIINQEDLERISEVSAKLGASMREACEAVKMAAEAVARLFNQACEDYALSVLATDREWHLMNNAKKYRTRKKYRNRLIKRYLKKTKKEE